MFHEKLIEEVKKHHILYQNSSGGYKNVAAKCRIWNDIAQKLGSIDETCQKTWKALRDRFCKEIKKMNCPSGSAAPTENLWEYWELLLFLKDHIKPRRTIGNFSIDCTEDTTQYTSSGLEANIIEESIDLELNAESSTSTSQITPIPKKSRKNDFDEKFTETMDSFNNYLKMKTNSAAAAAAAAPEPKPSSANSFTVAVTSIIENLSVRKQKIVKAQILKLLSDAQLDDLDDIIQFDNI